MDNVKEIGRFLTMKSERFDCRSISVVWCNFSFGYKDYKGSWVF